MKYVIDASVALACVLNEPDSAAANALRDDFKRQFHELIAPDLLPAEMAHALTKAERRRIIRQGEAEVLLATFLNPSPILHPYGPLLSRAIELSSRQRVGFYDCLYVALAEREQCSVVTIDQPLVAHFRGLSFTCHHCSSTAI